MEVNIHQAKSQLSQLLRRVAAGEEVIIARGGKPVAKLIPIGGCDRRVLGCDQGRFSVPEDFDAPLDGDILGSFEG
jgi:prevent-host-death family protein